MNGFLTMKFMQSYTQALGILEPAIVQSADSTCNTTIDRANSAAELHHE